MQTGLVRFLKLRHGSFVEFVLRFHHGLATAFVLIHRMA
jgi:hypothetical protein